MDEEWLTVTASAKYLGVSRRKIARLIDSGELNPVPNKLDNRERLIPKSQLDALKPGRVIRQEFESLKPSRIQAANHDTEI